MQKFTILVVDDDPAIRNLINRLLTSNPDYRVVLAGDSKQAVRAFYNERRIDVVLTDIHMPDHTGIEMMSDMKMINYKPEILVMTANGTPENVEKARKIGARSLLLKPFDNLEVIEAEISKAIEAVAEKRGEELPQEPTLELAEPTLELAEPTLELAEPTLELAEPMLELAEPTLEPAEPTLEPAEPTLELAEPTLELAEPTLELAEDTEGLKLQGPIVPARKSDIMAVSDEIQKGFAEDEVIPSGPTTIPRRLIVSATADIDPPESDANKFAAAMAWAAGCSRTLFAAARRWATRLAVILAAAARGPGARLARGVAAAARRGAKGLSVILAAAARGSAAGLTRGMAAAARGSTAGLTRGMAAAKRRATGAARFLASAKGRLAGRRRLLLATGFAMAAVLVVWALIGRGQPRELPLNATSKPVPLEISPAAPAPPLPEPEEAATVEVASNEQQTPLAGDEASPTNESTVVAKPPASRAARKKPPPPRKRPTVASKKAPPRVATEKAPEAVATDGRAGARTASGLAYLDIQVKSLVQAGGTLTMWVDGKRMFTHRLSAQGDKKRNVKRLFRKSRETFNAWIEIPPGTYSLKIQVLEEGANSAHEDTTSLEVGRGEVSKFKLVLGKKKEFISLEAD